MRSNVTWKFDRYDSHKSDDDDYNDDDDDDNDDDDAIEHDFGLPIGHKYAMCFQCLSKTQFQMKGL